MHWDGDVSGLVRSHLKATLKHLACLEYSTVEIQNRAIDDFLAGPEHIFSILESALPEVHRMRKAYPDAVVLPAASELPAPLYKNKVMKPPVNPVVIGYRLVRGILHNLTVADPAHHERPEYNVPTQDARWFRLCTVDGVTVTTADGGGVVYRQRDRAKMFSLLFQSVRRQRQLARRFDEMRKAYRDALPVLSSKQKWEMVLLPAAGAATNHEPRHGSRSG
jgi:galactofuranosylgalactofuranosylrhamnosyl-N-acetylglucosaminyl-diphospho-decaprenol beta-1,5/1,6-galactofuranosyltransferase